MKRIENSLYSEDKSAKPAMRLRLFRDPIVEQTKTKPIFKTIVIEQIILVQLRLEHHPFSISCLVKTK
jgi:hypothetical protein